MLVPSGIFPNLVYRAWVDKWGEGEKHIHVGKRNRTRINFHWSSDRQTFNSSKGKKHEIKRGLKKKHDKERNPFIETTIIALKFIIQFSVILLKHQSGEEYRDDAFERGEK